MKPISTFKRTVLATAAAATALVVFVPVTASAQSYGSAYDQQGGYSYDACRRAQTGRATAGALLGAAAGIALGNNSSNRYSRRHDASAAAGVLGAVVGAQVGKNSAACTPETPAYVASAAPAYGSGYGAGYGGYDRGYDDRGYADTRSYASSSYGDRGNGCTYAESPVYMPDGRTQTRMVQVCPDRNGHYQVVQ